MNSLRLRKNLFRLRLISGAGVIFFLKNRLLYNRKVDFQLELSVWENFLLSESTETGLLLNLDVGSADARSVRVCESSIIRIQDQ